MTVILYAVALLVLRGVSESSCYRIKRNTYCFGTAQQHGQCIPISHCREFSELLDKDTITLDEASLINSRKNACHYLNSTVPLYCCYNPIIMTTPIPITESTTTTTQRITTTLPSTIRTTISSTTTTESTTSATQRILTTLPSIIKTTISSTTTTESTTSATQRISTITINTKPTTESSTKTSRRITSAFTPTKAATRKPKPTIKKYGSYVPKSCGIHTAQKNVTFGWTVLIGTGHFYRRCVGTLINDGFVLTAAHCVYEVKPNNITLFFGSIKVEELPQCASDNYRCQEARAEKIMIHTDYNDTTNAFNVALIKTTLDMKHYSMHFINPICLPLNTTDDDTDPAKRHILRPLIYGTNNELQEACGYSGAPIVVIDSYKLYHVVGVANHPVDCDRKRVKRDATPTMEYVDWILQILTEGKEHLEPWDVKNQTQQQDNDRYTAP